jgi:hypothetical protein
VHFPYTATETIDAASIGSFGLLWFGMACTQSMDEMFPYLTVTLARNLRDKEGSIILDFQENSQEYEKKDMWKNIKVLAAEMATDEKNTWTKMNLNMPASTSVTDYMKTIKSTFDKDKEYLGNLACFLSAVSIRMSNRNLDHVLEVMSGRALAAYESLFGENPAKLTEVIMDKRVFQNYATKIGPGTRLLRGVLIPYCVVRIAWAAAKDIEHPGNEPLMFCFGRHLRYSGMPLIKAFFTLMSVYHVMSDQVIECTLLPETRLSIIYCIEFAERYITGMVEDPTVEYSRLIQGNCFQHMTVVQNKEYYYLLVSAAASGDDESEGIGAMESFKKVVLSLPSIYKDKCKAIKEFFYVSILESKMYSTTTRAAVDTFLKNRKGKTSNVVSLKEKFMTSSDSDDETGDEGLKTSKIVALPKKKKFGFKTTMSNTMRENDEKKHFFSEEAQKEFIKKMQEMNLDASRVATMFPIAK